jgi:hypothetical protein
MAEIVQAQVTIIFFNSMASYFCLSNYNMLVAVRNESYFFENRLKRRSQPDSRVCVCVLSGHYFHG